MTRIVPLSYNAMFKAVFSHNKVMLLRMIEAIFKYCNIKIDIQDKDIIIKNNELSLSNVHDRQLICDYVIKVNDYMELNIEINRTRYPGLIERNMTYSFKIYCDYFKSGNRYQEFTKYSLLQVNFNHYSNPNKKNINKYFMLDADDLGNYLSKNLCIINIDIDSCYKFVYNKDKLEEISDLERIGAILYTDTLEDISFILGSMIQMEDKEKFLKDVEEKSKDKDVLNSLKFEDNIDYRFDLVEEEALERGIKEGIEQGIEQSIKNMLKKNIKVEDIADITDRRIEDIEEIKNTVLCQIVLVDNKFDK